MNERTRVSSWTSKHQIAMQKCFQREMEKILQIRRLQEAFVKEEHNRVTKTVERMHSRMRASERSNKGASLRSHSLPNSHAIGQAPGAIQTRRLAARTRNQPAGVHWQGTCTLQLFAKPLTSLHQRQALDTKKSDFSRFQPLPDVPVQRRDVDAMAIEVIEPEDTHVPPNSRCDVTSRQDDGQCLTVPKITVRAATPSTCSESGGSDLSLTQSAHKYQEGRQKLTRLIQDLAKDTER